MAPVNECRGSRLLRANPSTISTHIRGLTQNPKFESSRGNQDRQSRHRLESLAKPYMLSSFSPIRYFWRRNEKRHTRTTRSNSDMSLVLSQPGRKIVLNVFFCPIYNLCPFSAAFRFYPMPAFEGRRMLLRDQVCQLPDRGQGREEGGAKNAKSDNLESCHFPNQHNRRAEGFISMVTKRQLPPDPNVSTRSGKPMPF